ncbi:hypothetical protein ACHWQZ_G001901 [Mnemiopsis leidyi]
MTSNLKLDKKFREIFLPHEEGLFTFEGNLRRLSTLNDEPVSSVNGSGPTTQPIPVLIGNRTRSTVSVTDEGALNIASGQERPLNNHRVPNSIQTYSGADHFHDPGNTVQWGRNLLENRIPTAQDPGRTTSSSQMLSRESSANGSNTRSRQNTVTENQDIEMSHTKSRKRNYNSSRSKHRSSDNTRVPISEKGRNSMSERKLEAYLTSGENEIPTRVDIPELKLENIPILSWNIHDSNTSKEGPKAEDIEFAAILARSTIFCLQETKQEFFLPNYECFNSTRNNSRSGGICIGVHRSLSKQVKLVETGCPDFQAITVYPHDSNNKFTIINVYDSPEQSSYKAKRRLNDGEEVTLSTLELLLEFRANNTDLGDVMMVGDMNARTGNLNIGPVNDEDLENDIPSSHPGSSETS